ncbi:MAG: hypothetical protein ABIR35_12235 [Polaromonas sp.]
MSKPKANPAALPAKLVAFGALFATFYVVVDAMTAFSFTLAASVVLASS